MKNIFLQILALLSFVLVSNCNTDAISEGFDLELSTDIFQQRAVIEIFDTSNPSNLEGNQVLSVEVIGEDAAKLVTDSGENISKLKVVDGIISLAVNPNKNITNEKVQFALKITGDNYLTTTIPVQLYENDTAAYFSSSIVNKLNRPVGVDFLSENITLLNNTLASTTSVKTNIIKGNTYSEVVIENGTIFQDINGNDISGNNLEIELTNFNSIDDESLASFPGGFMPLEITNEAGETQNDAAFQTLGFVSIDMKIGNTEVKNFSKPITITTQIQNDFINPETGENIKVGDEVPLWSYTRDDGTWDFHGTGIVSLDASNNLVITYTTTQLSWYNIDYLLERCSSNNSEITVSLNPFGDLAPGESHPSYHLYSDFVYEDTNQPISNSSGKTRVFMNGTTISTGAGMVSDRNIVMLIYSGKSAYNKGEIIFKSEPFNNCGIDFSIDVSAIGNKVYPTGNIHIHTETLCSGKIITPTVPIWIKDLNENGETYWRYIDIIKNGQITFYDLTLNTEYEFKTIYNGSSYFQTMSFHTFDSSIYMEMDPNLEDELCNNF